MAFYEDHALPGRCWRHGERTFTQTYDSLQHRVGQCMAESPALQQCAAEAGQLYQAMADAAITDTRLNCSAGERHRILTRAKALRMALEQHDPTIRHLPWTAPLTQPQQPDSPVPACVHQEQVTAAACGMEEAEVSPYCALLSACLLLAALFEQMPFSDNDIRRRVSADYTTLKREFRHSPMRVLHGPTTSVGELFGSIKDMDKQGLCDNVQGIVFDDWAVHRRVDCFLNCGLDVEATCLTQEGPIGRIHCRLRTFLILAQLQERLLKDLFVKFCAAPVRGCEAMSSDDPLDYYDYVEAMTRNTPCAYSASRGLYYAWLYAPEVNATPHNWETIFGAGANRLPSLYDGITTPDAAVVADPTSDSGYSMDLATAQGLDFGDAGAQAAVGYPWADDFLGLFLRRIREKRQQQQPQLQKDSTQGAGQAGACQEPIPGKCQQQQAAGQQVPTAAEGNGSGDEESVGTLANNEGLLLMNGHCKLQAPCDVEDNRASKRLKCDCQCQPQQQEQEHPGQRKQCQAHQQEQQRGASGAWDRACELNGIKQEESQPVAGPGPSSAAAAAAAAMCRGCGARQHHRHAFSHASDASDAAVPSALPQRLPLPLGVFLVGIITSSAFTNTQIHIEDLMLMSINVNIFGAPKIWWWIPQEHVPAFKAFAEEEYCPQDLYTKAVAPFLMDKSTAPHEHRLPLSKLKEYGARRVIQMPGMAVMTSPGYAFHFTVSMGLNIAESCNMFLEMMGWDAEKLWKERPLEQYPDPDNSMAKWMQENGLVRELGLEANVLHA